MQTVPEHFHGPRSPLHRTALLAAVCALAGAGAGTALAAAPPPPGGPAIGQYVEDPAAAGGSAAPGVGKTHSKPLPKKVRRQLKQADTPLAPKLTSIATSSQFGAPQQALRTARPAHAQTRPAPAKPTSTRPPPASAQQASPGRRTLDQHRNALSAAVSAATGGTSSAPVILLGAIVLLTTAAGIAAAARRARRSR